MKRARDFEAVLVLGCHCATHTARVTLEDTDCRVFQGMRELGLANATIKVRYPMTVELDPHPLPDKLFGRRREAPADAATKTEELVS